jgi:hypothetical protein
VVQGTVIATEIGNRRIYELNRKHVAAEIATLLAGLRPEMFKRMRQAIARWNPGPLYACVFGSAARGDGTTESDIDLLAVHSPQKGERSPRGRSGKPADIFWAAGEETFSIPMSDREFRKWTDNVDGLRNSVQHWTGNRLQVVELSIFQWRDMQRKKNPLAQEISRDAIVLLDRQVRPQ